MWILTSDVNAACTTIGAEELALCFPHRSARIERLPATPILAGNGGGWIEDRVCDLAAAREDVARVQSAQKGAS